MIRDRYIIILLVILFTALITYYQCSTSPAGGKTLLVIPPDKTDYYDFTMLDILRIDKHGEVFINWDKAEKYLQHCKDFTTEECGITKIIMAVRYENWKPYP